MDIMLLTLITADNLAQVLSFVLDQIKNVFQIATSKAGLIGIGIICIPLISRVFAILKKYIL